MEVITLYLTNEVTKTVTALKPPMNLTIDSLGYTIKDSDNGLVAYFPMGFVNYLETNLSEKAQ